MYSDRTIAQTAMFLTLHSINGRNEIKMLSALQRTSILCDTFNWNSDDFYHCLFLPLSLDPPSLVQEFISLWILELLITNYHLIRTL